MLDVLNLGKMIGFLSPGTKQTVHNKEVSALVGVHKAWFDCTKGFLWGLSTINSFFKIWFATLNF